jgi:ribose 5-phosphate isomerase A
MDDAARLAALAKRAADEIEPGMTLGLGSGSTAAAVVRELGARVAAGLAIRGVPTSEGTRRLADELGIPLLTLDDVGRLEFGFDGADEIDPALNLVKGGGGAFLHEKLVALACERYLVVAAAEKLVDHLGARMPLPVEVVPFGWRHTAARLEAKGLRPTQRMNKGDGEPYLTDGGHFVLDCRPDPFADPGSLATEIKGVAGVVEHGLFVGFPLRVLVVDADGTVRVLERPSGAA